MVCIKQKIILTIKSILANWKILGMGPTLLVTLIGLLVVIQQNDASDIFEQVFNGYNAKPGQFPYQAFLESDKQGVTGQWLCGGSLISNRHVLTAAHCLDGVTLTNVYLGITDQENGKGVVSYQVPRSGLTIHPNYDKESVTNDLGVIRLPSTVPFTGQISPINLPRRGWMDPSTFDNYKAILSGFGLTENQEQLPHRILQYRQILVMPHSSCAADNMNPPITNGMICTDRRVNSGHCQGDSGGPLAVVLNSGRYLIGVVSWGYRPCINDRPSVYVNVAYYLDWISQVTQLSIS